MHSALTTKGRVLATSPFPYGISLLKILPAQGWLCVLTSRCSHYVTKKWRNHVTARKRFVTSRIRIRILIPATVCIEWKGLARLSLVQTCLEYLQTLLVQSQGSDKVCQTMHRYLSSSGPPESALRCRAIELQYRSRAAFVWCRLEPLQGGPVLERVQNSFPHPTLLQGCYLQPILKGTQNRNAFRNWKGASHERL